MLKKMLNTFAAKFLTLALVMVALAPLVGYNATQAAPTLMANTQAVQEELSLDLNSNPTPIENALNKATLSVGVNIEDGGYIITDAFQAQKENKFGAQCPKQGEYYICDTPNLTTGAFSVTFKDVPGWTTPAEVGVQLGANGDTVYGNYVKKDVPVNTATLSVGVNIPEGGYVITDAFQAEKENKLGSECTKKGEYYVCDTLSLTTGAFTVTFKEVPGWTTPAEVGVQLGPNGDTVYGVYTQKNVPVNKATLNVGVNIPEGGYMITDAFQAKKEDKNGTDCALKGSYYTCATPDLTTGAFTVTFKEVAGWTTPAEKGVQLGANGDTVYGDYVKKDSGDTVNFNVSTKDDDGKALTEQYVRNALTTHNTPDSFSEKLANLNGYSFEFKSKPGYTKPGTVIVSNKVINSIPAHVAILENGSSYNVGTQLKANATYSIIGTYVDNGDDDGNLFKVTKTSTEKLLTDGNKEVTYKILVKRADNDVTGTYSIEVDDSVNNNGNKTIKGDNGGTLKVIGNGTCSNGCGDITDGPVTVKTTKPDQEVTLTYTMRSDNSDIPEGEISNFVNTVVGNYEDKDGKDKQTTDKETVKVPGDDDNNGNLFTVTKQATEKDLGNGNKEATFVVTVKRNNNGLTGTYYILVDDTINDNGSRSLTGSNGGTMKVVANSNGTYSTCSNGCGDITAGPVNVKTTSPGDEVTMTYTVRTDNSTVPNGQTSNFVNTAIGKYTQDGQAKETSDQATVTASKGNNGGVVLPPAPTPAPAPATPTPAANATTGPGNILLILLASGLAAYGWQVIAQRKKLALNK